MSPHCLDYLECLFWLSARWFITKVIPLHWKRFVQRELSWDLTQPCEARFNHILRSSSCYMMEVRNGIEVLGQFISCADASTRTNLFSDFCCKHRWYISWCISITFSQCICSRDGAWWLHKEMLWGDSHQHCTKRPKCATSDLDALQETSMGWYKKTSTLCEYVQVV